MAQRANLRFFHPLNSNRNLRDGFDLHMIHNRETGRMDRMGLVIGGINAKKGMPTRGSKVVQADVNRAPVIGERMNVREGSIVEVPFKGPDGEDWKRKMLVAREEGDDAAYLHIRTGFTGVSVGAHIMKLLGQSQEPMTHGSFALDPGMMALETAEEAVAGADVSEEHVAAVRLRWAVKNGDVPDGYTMPERRFDLWKIPKGAGILVRDVDGSLVRVVHEAGGIRVVDAPAKTFTAVFDEMEAVRVTARAAARQRRQDAAQAPGSEDTATAGAPSAPAEPAAPATAEGETSPRRGFFS